MSQSDTDEETTIHTQGWAVGGAILGAFVGLFIQTSSSLIFDLGILLGLSLIGAVIANEIEYQWLKRKSKPNHSKKSKKDGQESETPDNPKELGSQPDLSPIHEDMEEIKGKISDLEKSIDAFKIEHRSNYAKTKKPPREPLKSTDTNERQTGKHGKGIHIGSENIILAYQEESETVFVSQANAFVEIEYSDMAEQMLSRSDVPHIRKEDKVYVVGDDALNFANIFNKETRRPMQHGILSSDEASAIPMIKLIIKQVVGEPSRLNERLFYSSPADPIDSGLTTLYHEKTLESMLGDMGYDPEPINEGMAVIYSELADNNFTGLGISFGAGMTNVCLAYYAVPVMKFSITRGGDWIDEQTSRTTETPIDEVRSIRKDDFDLSFTGGGVESVLSMYFEDLIEYLTENIADKIDEDSVEKELDVPVVVAGGASSPNGFEDLLTNHLANANIPFSISGVRSADKPMYSVAAGALLAAKSQNYKMWEQSEEGVETEDRYS